MKLHHLIFLTTAVFIVLFYDENIGLNLGIFGLFIAVFTLYRTPEINRNKEILILFVTSVLSSFAFMWFGDFSSFLALLTSLLIMNLKSRNRKIKAVLVIPIFFINLFTFVCRFFSFEKWFPKTKSEGFSRKFVSMVIIPLIFVFTFFAIYTYGSDHFSNFYTNFEWNLNFVQLFLIGILGFFIAFNFWNFAIERNFYRSNHFFDNDFKNLEKINTPFLGILDVDAQRMSGLITFTALNILLLFFIITYNYEQFYEIPKTTNQLSEETHDRVNTVILSIVMAIFMILIYFRGALNFDRKAKFLKISAKIWIILNAVLVISAIMKNTEYLENMGLTYKKLGVYAFMILCIIGLVITFIKIQKAKTNSFLFNHMIWYFYGTILVCSMINWGGIITAYNIRRSDFAVNFHKSSINFSERNLLKYADEKNDRKLKNEILFKILSEQKSQILSKNLYYESLKNKK